MIATLKWTSISTSRLKSFGCKSAERERHLKMISLHHVELGHVGNICRTHGCCSATLASLSSTTLLAGHTVTPGKFICHTGWSVESRVVIVGWISKWD